MLKKPRAGLSDEDGSLASNCWWQGLGESGVRTYFVASAAGRRRRRRRPYDVAFSSGVVKMVTMTLYPSRRPRKDEEDFTAPLASAAAWPGALASGISPMYGIFVAS